MTCSLIPRISHALGRQPASRARHQQDGRATAYGAPLRRCIYLPIQGYPEYLARVTTQTGIPNA